MRYLIDTTMPCIVHNQRTIALLLLDNIAYFGIAMARRRRLFCIGVPHHFFDLVSGIQRSNVISSVISILHMHVSIAIIAHKHQHILPCTSILIVDIIDGFVNHYLGFGLCSNWETPHSKI